MSDKAEAKKFAELKIQYAGLVERIARKQFASNKDSSRQLKDYIQEGNLGLLEAARTFEAGKNVKFITHAYHCIFKAVSDSAREQGTIRISPYKKERLAAAEKALRAAQAQGKTLSDEELLAQSKLRYSDVIALKRLQPQSLDAALTKSNGEDSFTLADIIPDPVAAHNPERAVTRHCFENEAFERAVKGLYRRVSEKQKIGLSVIAEGLEVDEAAERFDITPQEVKSYKVAALESARRDISGEEVFGRG